MPTNSKARCHIEELIPSHLEGKIYELGCGWGELAYHIAKKHPEATVHALEVSPFPWLWAYMRFQMSPLPNLRLFWEDIFRVSVNDANVIVCYLYPGAMERLKKKFEKELSPGTLIISNSFAIPGWEPTEVVRVNDLYRTKIYVYKR